MRVHCSGYIENRWMVEWVGEGFYVCAGPGPACNPYMEWSRAYVAYENAFWQKHDFWPGSGGRHCKTKGQTLQPFPSPIAWSTMQIGKPEKRNAHTCTHTHTHPATKITLHIGWRPINWQEKRDLGAWVLCLGDYLPHAPFAFCFLQKSRGQWTQTQRR